jgi:Zn-finger nucleic acid-binding protein
MKCPICSDEMIVMEWQQIELDFCANNHGMWFDEEEIDLLPFNSAFQNSNLFSDWRKAPIQVIGEDIRKCPRCGSKMDKVKLEGVILDRCPKNHGIWFDGSEFNQIYSKSLSDPVLNCVSSAVSSEFFRP